MSRPTVAVVVTTLVLLFCGVLIGAAAVALDQPACPRDHQVYYPGRVECSDRPVNSDYGRQP